MTGQRPTSYFSRLGRGLNGDRGATAIEYAIMAAFIAAVIVTVVLVIGQQTQSLFECTSDTFSTGVPSC